MRPVPAALASALGALDPVLQSVGAYVRDRLRAELAGLQPVAIVHRVKDTESVYQKLQTGRYASLSDLDDLVGVKVVLLRRGLLREAQDVVEGCGLTLVATSARAVDPQDFRYREPKVCVRLPADYTARHPETSSITVEVQFTTALQHALDVATHDFDYQGRTYSWGNFRLVAQLRGTLELVDRILDDIHAASVLAEVEPQPPAQYVLAQALSVAITETFAEEALPDDRRRMMDTVAGWLQSVGITADDLQDLLNRHMDLVEALSIDPTAAILGALLRERADELYASYPEYLPISEELASLCPTVALPDDSKRVSFS